MNTTITQIKETTMISVPLNLFIISMTATPGPANMAHLASGQSIGFRKSLPFLAGNAAGLFFMNMSVGFGLGSLIQSNPAITLSVKLAGMAYIIYLAVCIIRSSSAASAGQGNFSFMHGVLLQFLNPKSWAMSVSAFSQFSDPAMPMASQIAGFALCFLFWQPISHGLWTAAGVGIMGWLQKSRPRRLIFNICASILMVGSTAWSLYL